jgi:hypothetical protein
MVAAGRLVKVLAAAAVHTANTIASLLVVVAAALALAAVPATIKLLGALAREASGVLAAMAQLLLLQAHLFSVQAAVAVAALSLMAGQAQAVAAPVAGVLVRQTLAAAAAVLLVAQAAAVAPVLSSFAIVSKRKVTHGTFCST